MSDFKKGIVAVPDDFKGVDWIGKAKSAGLNTLGIHSGGGAAHDIFVNLGEYASTEFQQRVAASGLELEYELHASKNLMPEKWFDTHPEYFQQTQRSMERVRDFNWCVSNPDTLKIIGNSAADIIRRLPSSTHDYFLWACDAPGQWCHCRGCTPYTFSEQALISANTIADAAVTVDPQAKVCYLAYLDTLETPRLVRPRPNVICEYAPYRRSYEYAICDSRSGANRQHLKYLIELLELFGAEKMHILEYWLDGSLYGKPGDLHKSPFNKKIAEEDIRFYTSLGIKNITTFIVRMDGAYLEKYSDREFQEYAEVVNKYVCG